MPNITSALNELIRRIARREVNAKTRSTRRMTSQHRRDVATLKRQVATLMKTLSFLEEQERRRVANQPVAAAPPAAEGMRFRADGLRARRVRLGLSAEDFGRLLGVSAPTVYLWETGKVRPRAEQRVKLMSMRSLGKRDAQRRLQLLGVSVAAPRRTPYSQTAEEFVASLVKSKKAATSAQINEAWRNSGRPGKADNTLTRMVATGKLKRAKLTGQRGSRYSN